MTEETSSKQSSPPIPPEVLQIPEVKNINPGLVSQSPQESTALIHEPVAEKSETSKEILEGAKDLPTFTHEYLRQYIELADQKAAFIFAIVSAIIGFTITNKKSPFIIPMTSENVWSLLAGYGAIVFLIVSGLLAIWLVIPNLKGKHKPGLIFWEEILSHDTMEKYVESSCKQNEQSASIEIISHSYILAQICQKKYFYLKASMYLGLTGLILLGIYLRPILNLLGS